jgi:hypothetical protein
MQLHAHLQGQVFTTGAIFTKQLLHFFNFYVIHREHLNWCQVHLGKFLISLPLLSHTLTVWTVDFETPVCKLYFLFLSADAAPKKEESFAAYWCFKVYRPYNSY